MFAGEFCRLLVLVFKAGLRELSRLQVKWKF